MILPLPLIYTGLAASLLGLALGGWLGTRAGDVKLAQCRADHEQLVATHARELAEQRRAALEETEQRLAAVEKERRNAEQRRKASQANADRAGRELERVRDELATARLLVPVAAADAVREYADTVTGLLAESERDYLEAARAAQGHADDVLTLQRSWEAVRDARRQDR